MIVRQEDVTDNESFQLSKSIAKKIEQVTYPGQIKVDGDPGKPLHRVRQMKVLFIGDIMGEPGRRAVARLNARLVSQRQIDVVVKRRKCGRRFGITPELAEELFGVGLSASPPATTHGIRRRSWIISPRTPLAAAANYPEGVPGQGSVIVQAKNGEEIAIVQLMGRAYMPTLDCPFQVAKRKWGS